MRRPGCSLSGERKPLGLTMAQAHYTPRDDYRLCAGIRKHDNRLWKF
ncbi:hypothetical protein ACE3MZ_00125 [Paenibacillus sp. WLX1005]